MKTRKTRKTRKWRYWLVERKSLDKLGVTTLDIRDAHEYQAWYIEFLWEVGCAVPLVGGEK